MKTIKLLLAIGVSALPAAALIAAPQALPCGAIGTTLTPGPIDVDGDGTNDINFVSFGINSGFLDRIAPYGLVGNIGGGPGSGAAWVRSTSTTVATDGVGRNEIIAAFRGAVASSDDNWSKVHLSSGDGWVQWDLGANRSEVTPLAFVRERAGQDLSAAQANALLPPTVFSSGGAIGSMLTPGPIDVDGDGTNDINFVSFGVTSGFLDRIAPYGLVGNIGGGPGSGAAWVRSTSTTVATDGVGRNEIIAAFRGAVASSDDNWSKVHLSSGDGWVQWDLGANRSEVTPLVFVRERAGQDLSAAQAALSASTLASPCRIVDAAARSILGEGAGGIPDNGGPGNPLTLTFTISGVPGRVRSVEVACELTHTWVGDLEIILTAPSGESHTILSRVGSSGTGFGDSSDFGGVYVFGDTQTGDLWAEAALQGAAIAVTEGGYRTTAALSGTATVMDDAFACVEPNGTWTLTISDNAGQDLGSVAAASLTVTGGNGSFTTSGAGCPATFLSLSGRPCVGETIMIDANNLPPNTVAASMFLGTLFPSPIDLALFGSGGCTLDVDSFHQSGMSVAGTVATWTLPITSDPAVAGQSIDGQAVMIGTPVDTGTTFGLITSNVFSMEIGG